MNISTDWEEIDMPMRGAKKFPFPRVTISKNGFLVFNTRTLEEYKKDIFSTANFAKFLYNRTTSVILIKFLSDKPATGYSVRFNQVSGTIYASAWLRRAGIHLDEIGGRYPIEVREVGNLGQCVLIDLNKKEQ